MKLSEFKNEIFRRLDLLKANIWFTFQGELAYTGNNWAALFSTSFYTLSLLILLKVLFTNVRELAGYNYQEMLLVFLMTQFTYYINWTVSMRNIYELIADVNKGNLDLVLTKPVPALFYMSIRKINILQLLREGGAPTLAIVLSIKWYELTLTPVNTLIGIVILILGLWVMHVFTLIAALPVFWLGESESIVDLALQLSAGNGVLIPFEGYSRKMQVTLGTVIPVLIAAYFSSSAILHKSNPWLLLEWAAGMALIAGIVRIKLWNIAIKNYTSASS